MIEPFAGPIDAVVRVPGSKSVTNRALLLAALASGVTTLVDAAWCDDSERMVEGLRSFGFSVDVEASGTIANREIRVAGEAGTIPAGGATVNVGNAGTVARFLTAAASLGRGRFVIDGDPRMRERPIGDLVDALSALGVRAASTNGCPPVVVQAAGLAGGSTVVSGRASSQFLSGLLLVAPCASAAVRIDVSGELSSRPYVDMTLSMMRDFGVRVDSANGTTFSVGPAPYRSQPSYAIEPDASSASYMFAAAAIAGGRARVEGLGTKCRQGDVGFVRLLQHMGCRTRTTPDYAEVERAGTLRGIAVDLADMPDVAPTLAAVAPFASTPTTMRGIASARRKECDRISALCQELTRLGVVAIEHEDGLTIQPCESWRPGVVRTYRDHRMAMAFSLVGLRVPGIAIEDPGCVAKTFPNFFDVLEELRP